jgi:hypothetical protein
MTQMPPKPTEPCLTCKTDSWWWREDGWGRGEWVCGICHPNPNEEALK